MELLNCASNDLFILLRLKKSVPSPNVDIGVVSWLLPIDVFPHLIQREVPEHFWFSFDQVLQS